VIWQRQQASQNWPPNNPLRLMKCIAFNKAQQDAFCPTMLKTVRLLFIGATTENPSFE